MLPPAPLAEVRRGAARQLAADLHLRAEQRRRSRAARARSPSRGPRPGSSRSPARRAARATGTPSRCRSGGRAARGAACRAAGPDCGSSIASALTTTIGPAPPAAPSRYSAWTGRSARAAAAASAASPPSDTRQSASTTMTTSGGSASRCRRPNEIANPLPIPSRSRRSITVASRRPLRRPAPPRAAVSSLQLSATTISRRPSGAGGQGRAPSPRSGPPRRAPAPGRDAGRRAPDGASGSREPGQQRRERLDDNTTTGRQHDDGSRRRGQDRGRVAFNLAFRAFGTSSDTVASIRVENQVAVRDAADDDSPASSTALK